MMMSMAYQTIHHFLSLHPVFAPVIYVLSHVVFAICLIPCSPMALIAGVLWGKWLGLGISICSAFLSSCTTFALARFFLKEKIRAFMSKRYRKTDWFLAQTQKHGWKFVAAVQLNPAAPGSSLGYLFGLTGVEFSVYAFFLLLFMLPLQLLLVFCGDSFIEVIQGQLSWIFIIALGILLGYFGFGLRHEQKQ